jgi:hypothetical protein
MRVIATAVLFIAIATASPSSEGTVLAGERIVEDGTDGKTITVRDPAGATAAINDYTC